MDIKEAVRKNGSHQDVPESWGKLTWIANKTLGGTGGLTLGRAVIKKGESNPRHAHPNCEEVLYLLKGALEHTLGNEKQLLGPGDAIIVPAGVYHNGKNTGETDADMIVAYSSNIRETVLE